jgi:hypothetical protein
LSHERGALSGARRYDITSKKGRSVPAGEREQLRLGGVRRGETLGQHRGDLVQRLPVGGARGGGIGYARAVRNFRPVIASNLATVAAIAASARVSRSSSSRYRGKVGVPMGSALIS